jgi:hypothetical protein
MGDISKGVANTLYSAKKYTKKKFPLLHSNQIMKEKRRHGLPSFLSPWALGLLLLKKTWHPLLFDTLWVSQLLKKSCPPLLFDSLLVSSY